MADGSRKVIQVVKRNSTETLDVAVVNVGLDQDISTITAALATQLGYTPDPNDATQTIKLDFLYRARAWEENFLVVNAATTHNGESYDIVLRAHAYERILRMKSGAYIALTKVSTTGMSRL
jgi:hypothetical protein